MTTTQPSSTPITAEGAVTILRDALQFFIDRCDSGLAQSKTTYAKFKEVLAATDPAAIQPAVDAVDPNVFFDALADFKDTPMNASDGQAFFDNLCRAPQDAKAEQVGGPKQWKASDCKGMNTVCTTCNNDIMRCVLPLVARQSAPIEAGEQEHYSGDLDALVREYGNAPVIGAPRTRRVVMQDICRLAGEIFGPIAPIEAVELPPLPSMPHAAMLVGPNLESLSLRYTKEQVQDYARAYGQLCRDTARPASSVTSGADALRYAQQLATAIWQQHYATEAPQWKVLPDLYGALSQIDNMSTGLTRATKPASTAPATGSIADDAELRAKFERWCYNDTPESPNFQTARNALGDYDFAETDGAWHAWQYLARQSVAAPDSARDAALEEAWTAIEAKRRATINNPSAKNALFDATEIIRDLQATAPVQGKASDAEDGDNAEGLEILDDLIRNIEDKGNYTKEATLTFLGQIRQCFAARAQQQGGAA